MTTVQSAAMAMTHPATHVSSPTNRDSSLGYTLCVIAHVHHHTTTTTAAAAAAAVESPASVESRFDIPVTRHTCVVSLLREVAELVLPGALQPPKGSRHAAPPPVVLGGIFHHHTELAPELSVATLPKDAVLHFYYGEELRRRGGRGCELHVFDPKQPAGSARPAAYGSQPPSPSYYRGKGSSSVYSGGTTTSYGNGLSEEGDRSDEPPYVQMPPPPPHYSGGVSYASGQSYAGATTPPAAGGFGSKPSTAPRGNPWGFEERGKTYRIPIRSTHDAPYDPLTPPPTPSSPLQPQSYGQHPFLQQAQPQQPQQSQPGVFMMGPNGQVMPLMMVMPMFAPPPSSSAAASHGYAPSPYALPPPQTPDGSRLYEAPPPCVPGARGATATPANGTHAGQPRSISVSESKLSRSQRFFGGSEPNSDGLTSVVSEPREARHAPPGGGESPLEVENTARKRHTPRLSSPPPSRPEPRRLSFDHLEEDSSQRQPPPPRPARLQPAAVEAPRPRSAESGPKTPQRQMQTATDVREEDMQAKRQRLSRNPPQDEPSATTTTTKKKKGSGLDRKELHHEPLQTIFSVVSTMEPSDDYVFLNVEIPDGVDPQLVCGLGDNSATAVTVGSSPVPADVLRAAERRGNEKSSPKTSARGGEEEKKPGDATRRLRVHRQTPVGTLRALLNVTPHYGIWMNGAFVHDERETLEKLGVQHEAVIAFAEVARKLKPRRSMVVPPAFLSAMQSRSEEPPPQRAEKEEEQPVPTPIARQPKKERRTTHRKPSQARAAPAAAAAAEPRPKRNVTAAFASHPQQSVVSHDAVFQVLTPEKVKLHSGLHSAQVTPRVDYSGGQAVVRSPPPPPPPPSSYTAPTPQHVAAAAVEVLRQPYASVHAEDEQREGEEEAAAAAAGVRHFESPHQRSPPPPPPPGDTATRRGVAASEPDRSGGVRDGQRHTVAVKAHERSSGGRDPEHPSRRHDDEHAGPHLPAKEEPTIDINELSSAEEEEDEAALQQRMMMAAARPPPSGRNACPVQRRRSSVTLSHKVTTRRQRVKRTTQHALTIGTADDSVLVSEMDDTVLAPHSSSSRKRRALEEATAAAAKAMAQEEEEEPRRRPPAITLYTFKRRDSENVRQAGAAQRMLITIQDPRHPEVLHRDVPVDENCPVSILKAWLLREDVHGGHVSDEAVAQASIYYRGERVPLENERMTFKTVTEFFPNGIFSFQPPQEI